MGIIALIIIGAAAGFLATRIMDVPLGVPQTIAVGVIGALFGSLALRVLTSVLGVAAGFLGAVIGAVVLLWAYKAFVERR